MASATSMADGAKTDPSGVMVDEEKLRCADDSMDMTQDESDEDAPLGDFRIRVLPNGNLQLVMEDDEDDQDDDEDPEGDSNDAEMDKADCDDMDDDSMDKADAEMSSSEGEDPKDKKDKKDMMGEDAKKSVCFTEQSLSKALAAVEKFAESNDAEARKKALFAKAQTDQGLNKKELSELYKSLGGQTQAARSLASRATEALSPKGELSKAMPKSNGSSDVAEFLDGLREAMSKGLAMVANAQEAAAHRSHAVDLLQCKASAQIGAAVQAMAREMNVIKSQPIRAPKSLSARPMEKSFAGSDTSRSGMGQKELVDTLTEMNKLSFEQGRNGLSKSKQNIFHNISSVCTDGRIDPELLAEAKKFREAARQGA